MERKSKVTLWSWSIFWAFLGVLLALGMTIFGGLPKSASLTAFAVYAVMIACHFFTWMEGPADFVAGNGVLLRRLSLVAGATGLIMLVATQGGTACHICYALLVVPMAGIADVSKERCASIALPAIEICPYGESRTECSHRQGSASQQPELAAAGVK